MVCARKHHIMDVKPRRLTCENILRDTGVEQVGYLEEDLKE